MSQSVPTGWHINDIERDGSRMVAAWKERGRRMTATSLRDYQGAYPQAVVRVGSEDWAVRDTDPASGRTPVIFLPGAGGTGDVFYRTVASLKNVRRTVTVRYPALSEPDAIVSSLVGLLGELGLTSIDLAASSIGGYLAQALAIRRPALVRRVLLGNTFYDASWLQAKMSRDVVVSTPPAEHLARTTAQLKNLPESTEAQADYKATMLALVGVEQTGEMAVASLAAVLGSHPIGPIDLKLSAIAILDTDDDPVIDVSTRQAMRDRYRGASLFDLLSGGHYPSLLNPVDYTAAVMSHFGEE